MNRNFCLGIAFIYVTVMLPKLRICICNILGSYNRSYIFLLFPETTSQMFT